ncbi:MAG: ComEA family DNA-binding protein [Candidatus Omnitrophica bacterium]|nr:ComEA family DNA-binding protein [Candidatus Omnitrophota bacterium]
MKQNTPMIHLVGVFALAAFLFGNLSIFNTPRVYAAQPVLGEAQPAGLVNINQAGAEELEAIRGVGPALANRIVEFRNENGPFETIDDLANVKGIGGAKLQKIRVQATV